jgi:hypothetical protein
MHKSGEGRKEVISSLFQEMRCEIGLPSWVIQLITQQPMRKVLCMGGLPTESDENRIPWFTAE